MSIQNKRRLGALAAVLLVFWVAVPGSSLKGQEDSRVKKVKVWFANETGKDIVITIDGLKTSGRFQMGKNDPDKPVWFWEDGRERVIAAFSADDPKAICHFTLVPASVCVIIPTGKNKSDFHAPSGPDPTNDPY